MRALTVKGTPRKREYPTNRVARDASPLERVMRYVEKDANTGCWVWQAHTTNGYGQLTIKWKVYYAHRIAYESLVGPIPADLQIDHLCRNRACANPEHLEPVTAQVNTLRGESPGAKAQRRTHCEFDHPYSEHGVKRGGRRVCRVCRIAYCRIYNSLTAAERQRRRDVGEMVVDLAPFFAAHPVLEVSPIRHRPKARKNRRAA